MVFDDKSRRHGNRDQLIRELSQLLPEGQNQDDRQACLKWSAALLPVAPDLVPEPMRARWPAPA